MKVMSCEGCKVQVAGLCCRAGEALGPFSFLLFARLLFWEGCRIPLVELRQFKINLHIMMKFATHRFDRSQILGTLPIAGSNRGLSDGILSICCEDATAGCCEGR